MFQMDWSWAGYGAGYGNSVACLVATGTPGNIYAGSSNRHVYWHISGSSWPDTVTDMGSNVLSLTRSSNYVYASTANGIVYRYNNNPSSPAWTSLGYCGTSAAYISWNDSHGLYALGYNSHAWMYTGSSWSDTGLVGFFSITTFTSVGSMSMRGTARARCGLTAAPGATPPCLTLVGPSCRPSPPRGLTSSRRRSTVTSAGIARARGPISGLRGGRRSMPFSARAAACRRGARTARCTFMRETGPLTATT